MPNHPPTLQIGATTTESNQTATATPNKTTLTHDPSSTLPVIVDDVTHEDTIDIDGVGRSFPSQSHPAGDHQIIEIGASRVRRANSRTYRARAATSNTPPRQPLQPLPSRSISTTPTHSQHQNKTNRMFRAQSVPSPANTTSFPTPVMSPVMSPNAYMATSNAVHAPYSYGNVHGHTYIAQPPPVHMTALELYARNSQRVSSPPLSMHNTSSMQSTHSIPSRHSSPPMHPVSFFPPPPPPAPPSTISTSTQEPVPTSCNYPSYSQKHEKHNTERVVQEAHIQVTVHPSSATSDHEPQTLTQPVTDSANLHIPYKSSVDTHQPGISLLSSTAYTTEFDTEPHEVRIENEDKLSHESGDDDVGMNDDAMSLSSVSDNEEPVEALEEKAEKLHDCTMSTSPPPLAVRLDIPANTAVKPSISKHQTGAYLSTSIESNLTMLVKSDHGTQLSLWTDGGSGDAGHAAYKSVTQATSVDIGPVGALYGDMFGLNDEQQVYIEDEQASDDELEVETP